MEREHIVSRAAYAGLVALVIGFLGFAIGAALVTKDAARIESEAAQRSQLLEFARIDVADERSLGREYQLAPDPRLRAAHAAAAQRVVNALLAVRASTPTDAPAVDRVIAGHERYLTAARALFAAVDAGRRADGQEVDRLSAAVVDAIDVQASKTGAFADASRFMLRQTAEYQVDFTCLTSLGAVFALSLILLVLRRLRREVDAAIQHELESLKAAAFTDLLTHLGNQRAFQHDVSESTTERHAVDSVESVALVDIDDFRPLNDRYGHATGDRILVSLAYLLRSAEPGAKVYRLAGDRFALTFTGMSAAEARENLDRMRRRIVAEFGGMTVSIGIATSHDQHLGLQLLRDEADAALAEAKRRGRNTVVAFDEIEEEAAMFMPARVAEVRELIAGKLVGVAFQPIWSLRRRNIIGYEALARPIGENPVNPQDAFDIAERIGRAHDLDRVCRESVLRHAKLLPPGSLLFINVSPQSLDHEEFAGGALVEAVRAAGFAPSRVVLEITERSLARLPVVIREAKRLRELGFKLALDDAGAGNSGLEMLSQLTVDFVKIDRDVIVRAQTDIGGSAVLAGIIAIAQEMSAQIIAEGIEDGAMLDLVGNATRASTISGAVQGYYLGRPSNDFVDAAAQAIIERRLAHVDESNSILETS